MSSVRFICGTQDIHKELEHRIADFLSNWKMQFYMQQLSMLMVVLFEPLFGPEDAIISDELNHASIIDGVRLVQSQKDLDTSTAIWLDLEAQLIESQSHLRHRIHCYRWCLLYGR